jgi:hypothetical protein
MHTCLEAKPPSLSDGVLRNRILCILSTRRVARVGCIPTAVAGRDREKKSGWQSFHHAILATGRTLARYGGSFWKLQSFFPLCCLHLSQNVLAYLSSVEGGICKWPGIRAGMEYRLDLHRSKRRLGASHSATGRLSRFTHQRGSYSRMMEWDPQYQNGNS